MSAAVAETFAVATKAAVIRDGRVLVLRKTAEEHRGDHSADPADLPGGRLKHGEGLEDSLRREVLEETGLVVSVAGAIHAWGFVKSDGTHLVILLYRCRWEHGEVALGPEHKDCRWVAAGDTGRLPTWISEAVTLALAGGFGASTDTSTEGGRKVGPA